MPIAITTVTGTICKVDGTAVVGSQVRGTICSTEDDHGGQVASGSGVSSDQTEAFTDESGAFSIDFISGAIVLLEIPDINLRKEVLIPAASPVDFVSLI